MKEIRNLFLILFLALAHSLIYVFLVPPWQHYDEPNHFEFVWLTANVDRLPKPEDYNPKMSRQVLKSMLANGFFDQMESKPTVGPPDQKIRLPGYRQLREPPLYYMLASLPLRLLQSRGIDAQLYAARMVSLVFYLFTVLFTWGIARELVVSNHPLRWMLPLTVVLLPGFTDLMTAVNNDAAAVAILSLFLWGGVRLIQHGFTVSDFLWVIGAAVLAFFTKNTALIAWLMLPLVLFFTIFRGKLRWLAWSLLLGGLAVILVMNISRGDAAYWYRANSQVETTRLSSDEAILGDYVLQLDPQAEVTPNWLAPLFQPIPIKDAWRLRGKMVTLGAWIWSTESMEISTPSVNTPSLSISKDVKVGKEPAFYAFQVLLPEDAIKTWVAIPKFSKPGNSLVFYDGILLVEGERPVDQPPRFSAPDGSRGEWGGQPFVNLLRNPSMEREGFRVRLWVDNLASRILPDHTRASLILTSLLDWQAAGYLYQISARHLFQTFWARFGWGHIPLIGEPFSYWLLVGFTLVAGFGCIAGITRRKQGVPWDLIAFMGIGLFAAWGTTLVRGANSLGLQHQYVPVARHAYPLIIPAALFLCVGWLEVFYMVNTIKLRAGPRNVGPEITSSTSHPILVYDYQLVLYFSLLVLLDVASIVSIAIFFGKL